MITVENLRVEFGAVPLLEDVSFVVNSRDRIALVGKNGAGKSTLLKILCGVQAPTAGRVAIPADSVVAYLPQVLTVADDTTVRCETQKAFATRTAQQEHVAHLEEALAARTDYDSADYLALVARYTAAHDRLQMLGAQEEEAALERMLLGLGFLRQDFDRPTSAFSGGWRMRIEIAKLLLQKPDVLLLDEPTNHLDIESIQWLEQFLKDSAGAVVVVSHDRAFINNVTTRTIEIACRRITDYKVRYDEYVVLRQERRAQQLRAYENQQREIAAAEEFINRFRYKPSKAVQVQQKIKQLAKITPIEVDEIDTAALHLKFPPCRRAGDFPLLCDAVEKVWPAHYDKATGALIAPANTVFSNVSLTIKRGEKVAFVGKNGEGKTTLVKCIMAAATEGDDSGHHDTFYRGTLQIGHNVQIGYFAQDQAQHLDERLTVFETIDRVATGDIRLRIKNILGAFMFGGEAMDKKVQVLSGGERTRLAMIKLLLEPVNFLILDEPTNHLDMPSKEVLKEALRAFDGTAIIVSHDRAFLDGIVEKVYEFADGTVQEHIGGIYDFLRHRGMSDLTALNSRPKPAAAETATPAPAPTNYAARKAVQREIGRLERAIAASEKKVAQCESRCKELDTLLCIPTNAADITLVSEYTALRQTIAEEEQHWTALVAQLEEQTNKLQ